METSFRTRYVTLLRSADEIAEVVDRSPRGLRTEIRFGVSCRVVQKLFPEYPFGSENFLTLTYKLYDRALARRPIVVD